MRTGGEVQRGESALMVRHTPRGTAAAAIVTLHGGQEVSRRAVKAGFEWPEMGGVLDKAVEEFAELRVEIESNAPQEKIAAELGDLLFTLVNVGRRIGIDPEDALRRQMARFKRRFRHIEARAAEQNRLLESLTLDEMETYWREAKVRETAAEGDNAGE